MWGDAAVKIDDIHAMMASGHRSIRIERHTFILWGLAGALLIVLVNEIFTPEHFSVRWQRVLFSHLLISVVLISVAVFDFRMTRRERLNRDETLSFVQLQLTKLWWLFITLIVLINIGMNFYGGGYLFYPILLALLGMALYAQGLFSQQMLSWIGVCMILLGLGSIVSGTTLIHQKWLTVSALGFGFILLAWWADYPSVRASKLARALLSVAWLSLVIMPVAAGNWLTQNTDLDKLPTVSLETYRHSPSTNAQQIVHIPAGTNIPLNIEIQGDLIGHPATSSVQLKLAQAIDVVVSGAHAESTARVSGKAWKDLRNPYRITKFKLSASLDRSKGPEAKLLLGIVAK